jgi:hypothetical protein
MPDDGMGSSQRRRRGRGAADGPLRTRVWAAAAERRRGGRLVDLLGHIGRGLRWPVLGGESCAAAGIHRRGHGRREGGKEAVKCGGGEERWEQGQGGIAGTETPSAAAAAWSRRNGRRLLLVADLRPCICGAGLSQVEADLGRRGPRPSGGMAAAGRISATAERWGGGGGGKPRARRRGVARRRWGQRGWGPEEEAAGRGVRLPVRQCRGRRKAATGPPASRGGRLGRHGHERRRCEGKRRRR